MGQPAIDRTPIPTIKRPFLGTPAVQAINQAYGFTPPQDVVSASNIPSRLQMIRTR
jgi:hypothetical protein